MAKLCGYLKLLMVNASANPTPELRKQALGIPEGPATESELEKHFFSIACIAIQRAVGCEYKIYFLGDALYYWVEDEETFFRVTQDLRYTLLEHGYYFKGAIMSDREEPHTASELFETFGAVIGKNRRAALQERLSGIAFNSDTIELVRREELFKGIGFHMDLSEIDRSVNRTTLDKYIVETAFQITKQRSHFSRTADLKFDSIEITSPILWVEVSKHLRQKHKDADFDDLVSIQEQDLKKSIKAMWRPSNGARYEEPLFIAERPSEAHSMSKHRAGMFVDGIVRNFLTATRKSEEYARYYIPLFLTLIRSSDFRSILRFNQEWQLAPRIFFALMKPSVITAALRYKDFGIVYLQLIDKTIQAIEHNSQSWNGQEMARHALISKFTPSQIRTLVNSNTDLCTEGLAERIASTSALQLIHSKK